MEVSKLEQTLQKLQGDESKIFQALEAKQGESSMINNEVRQFLPIFYEKLWKMKYYGDQKLNEILLKQIELYQDRLFETCNEVEKVKKNLETTHSNISNLYSENLNYLNTLKLDAI